MATATTASGGDVTSKKPYRLDPTLTMSSTTTSADGEAASRTAFPRRKSTDSTHSRRSAASTTSNGPLDAKKLHRSSDRLHRVGGSGVRLSSAHRTKSQTLLATDGRKGGTLAPSNKGKGKAGRGEEEWDSTSHTSASTESGSNSPARSYGDEGLVMMSKKKKHPHKAVVEDVHPETSAGAPVPQRKDAPHREEISQGHTLAASRLSESQPGLALNPPPPGEGAPTLPTASSHLDRTSSPSSHLSNADSQDTLPVEAHAEELPSDGHDISTRRRSPAEGQFTTEHLGSSTNLQRVRSPTGDAVPHIVPHSPGSTRSRSSLASRTYSHAYAPAIAPPKLDTHNALVGALGALHEDRAATAGEMSGTATFSSSPSDAFSGHASGSRNRYSLDIDSMRSRSDSNWVPEDLHGAAASSSSSTIILPGSTRRRNVSGTSISNINVTSSGPVVGGVSRAAVTRHGSDASSNVTDLPHESGQHARGTNSSEAGSYGTIGRYDRIRKLSTQSLTAADAAKLATRMRAAREGTDDERNTNNRTRAAAALSRAGSAVGLNKLTTGSAGGAKTLSRTQTMPLGFGGGMGGGGASAGALGSHTSEAYYVKPVVSTFARTVGGADRTAPEAVVVRERSVFADGFGEARALVDQGEGGNRKGKGRGATDERHLRRGSGGSNASPLVRYVLPYGLSGPPFVRNALNDSILAPSFSTDEFDASWAPALANAAGLGTRARRHVGGGVDGTGALTSADSGVGMARATARTTDMAMMEMSMLLPDAGQASGTALANGPNAVPLHIVHGLTSISDKPFPLDGSELPAGLPSFGPGVHPSDMPATDDEGSLLVPHAALRALALTSCALAVSRAHTVTRRFADPMRSSLERVARDSARNGGFAAQVASGGGGTAVAAQTPTSPYSTWGGGAEGRRSQSEYATRPQANQYHPHRPSNASVTSSGGGNSTSIGGILSRTTSSASASTSSSTGTGASTSEAPLQSLKRVWSGGAARGGLAALTRTDEGAERP